MAGVGDIEKLVESLVNRGLVAPKFVGRQIGQATIETLKTLGQNLSQSNALRQNDAGQISISNAIKAAGVNSALRAGSFQDIINNSQRSQGPFVVGTTGPKTTGSVGSIQDNQYTIALPGENGFTLKSAYKNQDQGTNSLIDLALKNSSGKNIPTINSIYEGSGNTFKTIQDLKNALYGTATNAEEVNNFFK